MKAQLLRLALATFAAVVFFAAPQVSRATLLDRVLGEKVEAPAAAPAAEGCCAPKPCCPKPCIEYHEHRPCKKICCGCDAPHTVVFQVKDPCTCCVYDVPVCVPACCTEAPCIDDHCALFGRYVYEYNWCCGYKAKIILTRCGDIEVHTYGH